MKSFLSVLIVLTMIFAFSACGDDSSATKSTVSSNDSKSDTSSIDSDSQELLDMPQILWEVNCGDVPALDETVWNYAGAMVDLDNANAEMGEKILTEELEGSFQVAFEGGDSITFVKGGIPQSGTFTRGKDTANPYLKATVGDEEYYIRFGAGAVDKSALMIIATQKNPRDAYLLAQIEEK